MKRSMLPALLLVATLLGGAQGWSAEAAVPKVVVSIKPIHALVSAVMQGVGEPVLLVKGGGSPHGYVLRPSEARALAGAELVVWIGPQLESFLEKPLSTLGRDAAQLKMIEELRADLLPAREGGSWEEHGEDHDGPHGGDREMNPHLWLNPLLAQKVVENCAEALSRIDPGRSQTYAANAARVKVQLGDLHEHLERKLAPVRAVPYIVFHDAYQYFETAYNLNAVGSISVDPERRPGVKRLLEIREKIKTLQARCVFSEPQFEPQLVQAIIEGTGAGIGTLDPLGIDLPAGPEGYFTLLSRLADNLLTGLQ
ncbi:MAG: zinc ABC transporter substrate-binding protein [Desulfuromonadales bacterium]|nr:zinc ABC transporter substrate-binding protein [Desulfuromonadales bacterium]